MRFCGFLPSPNARYLLSAVQRLRVILCGAINCNSDWLYSHQSELIGKRVSKEYKKVQRLSCT